MTISTMMFHLLVAIIALATTSYGLESSEEYYKHTVSEHLKLFEPSDEVYVVGPSSFPKPTDIVMRIQNETATPCLKPVMGEHRPKEDAVIAFAAEYSVKNHAVFIRSLREHFDGDIVLIVSPLDIKNDDLMTFWKKQVNLVLYAPELECFNAEGESVASAKGGIRTCLAHNMYAVDGKPIKDPRHQRTLANTRYELYWLLTINYDPHSWIFLIDFRDTYFQGNPFTDVPRKTDPTGKSGVLYFFGENMEATRIGASKANRGWIEGAYGDVHADALAKKPTICSGASMGEQVALESYIRAIVAEGDETLTVKLGSDQGYHNRLYYSRKFQNCESIHAIVVFDQGTSIVNNLGAMRTKELSEWGTGEIVKIQDSRMTIYNWDGTLSPVVHQYDRHKELSKYVMSHYGRHAT